MDRWEGNRYVRVLFAGEQLCRVTVAQKKEKELEIDILSGNPIAEGREVITRQLIKMLGLEINLGNFYALAFQDPLLGPLVQRFLGAKPPCFVTIFEALLNAIACQQLTLDVGITLLNRLTENFGLKLLDNNTASQAFPRPEDLAGASFELIRKLGFSYQKTRSILELSTAIAEKQIGLSAMETMTNDAAVKYLAALRGIGRWSAEYVLLRGLGRLDVFPGDDVGAQRNLRNLFVLDHKPSYGEIKELTAPWQPYAGLVYFHLLLDKLRAGGHFDPSASAAIDNSAEHTAGQEVSYEGI